MIIGFIYFFYNKYNILIFKINNELFSLLFCDIIFIAIN